MKVTHSKISVLHYLPMHSSLHHAVRFLSREHSGCIGRCRVELGTCAAAWFYPFPTVQLSHAGAVLRRHQVDFPLQKPSRSAYITRDERVGACK